MKRTYLQPTIYVKKVKINNILQTSPSIIDDSTSSGTELPSGYEDYRDDYTGGGSGLAKSGFNWDSPTDW